MADVRGAVVEREDRYVLYAELPGVKAEELEIGFEQNVLTIRGTNRSPIDPASQGELRAFAAERVTGGFERALRLPDFVDGDHISAGSDTVLGSDPILGSDPVLVSDPISVSDPIFARVRFVRLGVRYAA